MTRAEEEKAKFFEDVQKEPAPKITIFAEAEKLAVAQKLFEEVCALRSWKAGAEKTLLENAALLEQAEKMILAAKDEIAKLREALLTIRNYSHACFYEGAHGDRRFDSLARMSAVALIIEEK